jgi:hypothetical protein
MIVITCLPGYLSNIKLKKKIICTYCRQSIDNVLCVYTHDQVTHWFLRLLHFKLTNTKRNLYRLHSLSNG